MYFFVIFCSPFPLRPQYRKFQMKPQKWQNECYNLHSLFERSFFFVDFASLHFSLYLSRSRINGLCAIEFWRNKWSRYCYDPIMEAYLASNCVFIARTHSKFLIEIRAGHFFCHQVLFHGEKKKHKQFYCFNLDQFKVKAHEIHFPIKKRFKLISCFPIHSFLSSVIQSGLPRFSNHVWNHCHWSFQQSPAKIVITALQSKSCAVDLRWFSTHF